MVRKSSGDGGLEIVKVADVERVLVPFIEVVVKGNEFEVVYADVWRDAEQIGAQVVESCTRPVVKKVMPYKTPQIFAHHSDIKGVKFPSDVTLTNAIKNDQFKFVVEVTVGLLAFC
jgi:hypothetical protein